MEKTARRPSDIGDSMVDDIGLSLSPLFLQPTNGLLGILSSKKVGLVKK